MESRRRGCLLNNPVNHVVAGRSRRVHEAGTLDWSVSASSENVRCAHEFIRRRRASFLQRLITRAGYRHTWIDRKFRCDLTVGVPGLCASALSIKFVFKRGARRRRMGVDPISRSVLQDIGFRFSCELLRTRVGKLHHSSSIARSYRCSSEGQAEPQDLNRPASATGFINTR